MFRNVVHVTVFGCLSKEKCLVQLKWTVFLFRVSTIGDLENETQKEKKKESQEKCR